MIITATVIAVAIYVKKKYFNKSKKVLPFRGRKKKRWVKRRLGFSRS